jgi:hypothetical protein
MPHERRKRHTQGRIRCPVYALVQRSKLRLQNGGLVGGSINLAP